MGRMGGVPSPSGSVLKASHPGLGDEIDKLPEYGPFRARLARSDPASLSSGPRKLFDIERDP